MFHLPDLPNAGYTTERERILSDEIMCFMREIERDRLRLLTIVVDGPDKWRKVASAIWLGLRIDSDLVDEIYRYFTLQAVLPNAQRLLLRCKNNDEWNAAVRRLMPKIERHREQVKEAMGARY